MSNIEAYWHCVAYDPDGVEIASFVPGNYETPAEQEAIFEHCLKDGGDWVAGIIFKHVLTDSETLEDLAIVSADEIETINQQFNIGMQGGMG